MNTPGCDIIHLVSRLRGLANAFLLERLAREGVTGLAPSHGAVLAVLYDHGPLPMKDVGEKVHRDKSTLTVLVRKLETGGYVRREVDAADRRLTRLSLTAKGKAFKRRFDRISAELLGKVWDDTPRERQASLCAGLTMLVERLEG